MGENRSLRNLLNEGAKKPWTETAEVIEIGDEGIQSVQYGRIGMRPQLMIGFMKSDGYFEALPYFSLKNIVSHGFQSVTLEFSERRILIEGTNLERLVRYLMQNRVVEIVEVDKHQAMAADANATIVYKLEIKPVVNQKRPPSGSP